MMGYGSNVEITVLNPLSPKAVAPEFLPRTLSYYIIQLAKLGGYLARKGDPSPGSTVMWRGLTRRRIDIVLGMPIAAEFVGN